jgi:hypothetical protein
MSTKTENDPFINSSWSKEEWDAIIEWYNTPVPLFYDPFIKWYLGKRKNRDANAERKD